MVLQERCTAGVEHLCLRDDFIFCTTFQEPYSLFSILDQHWGGGGGIPGEVLAEEDSHILVSIDRNEAIAI